MEEVTGSIPVARSFALKKGVMPSRHVFAKNRSKFYFLFPAEDSAGRVVRNFS